MTDRRLFFAIEISDTVQAKLSAVSKKLAEEASGGHWTHAGNLHLTLQFLGNCPDFWLPELKKILQLAAADCRPFQLCIEGLGIFGRTREILWLGVASQPALQLLVSHLRVLLQHSSLPFEVRPYLPHITVARQVVIDPAALLAWSWPPITFMANQVSLMESTRINGQLVYKPIERVAF